MLLKLVFSFGRENKVVDSLGLSAFVQIVLTVGSGQLQEVQYSQQSNFNRNFRYNEIN